MKITQLRKDEIPDTRHDRLGHLPTENQRPKPARIHFPARLREPLAPASAAARRPTAPKISAAQFRSTEVSARCKTYNGIVEPTVGRFPGKSAL